MGNTTSRPVSRSEQIWIWIATAVGVLIFLGIVGSCSEDQEGDLSLESVQEEQEDPNPTDSRDMDSEEMLIASMLEKQQVVDAEFSRVGDRVNVVLVVEKGIDGIYAYGLATDFVRMIKQFLDDGSTVGDPSITDFIGTGRYYYLIEIVLPNRELFERGEKPATDDRITW